MKILGNRLQIRRIDKLAITLKVGDIVLPATRNDDPTFEAEVLAVGCAEPHPMVKHNVMAQVKVGDRILCQRCGSAKLEDKTEIISILDVIAVIEP